MLPLELFKEVAANSYDKVLTKRLYPLYNRKDDTRNDFVRDYNRILHCLAYRRLKHKTQVFFAPDNDHICTRIEHVNHVTAISNTISKALGLNTDLTNAIAIGHDIGHAPFGHDGERILREIAKSEINQDFWHEKNSLWFADNIEVIRDENDKYQNLNLTYAVRDGLICHCGEDDEKEIRPRTDIINLNSIKKPGGIQPITWEACVVKIADKIAYLGRDIEDAYSLNIMSKDDFLYKLRNAFPNFNRNKVFHAAGIINNTILIHSFVTSLIRQSTPKKGLSLSEWHYDLMLNLRKVSRDLIYNNRRLNYSKGRVRLILYSIFDVLSGIYKNGISIESIQDALAYYPLLNDNFLRWVIKYTDLDLKEKTEKNYINRQVYNIQRKTQYKKSVIEYIAAMTDNYTIRLFSELTRFGYQSPISISSRKSS